MMILTSLKSQMMPRWIKEMEGKNITSSMTFAITRDSRDKLWDTSKGSYNRLRFEYAGGVLGGDIGFNKYIAKTGWFFPFSGIQFFWSKAHGASL